MKRKTKLGLGIAGLVGALVLTNPYSVVSETLAWPIKEYRTERRIQDGLRRGEIIDTSSAREHERLWQDIVASRLLSNGGDISYSGLWNYIIHY